MKKIYTAIITSILSLQTLAISAGNVADYAQSTTSGNSIVYINAPRFVRPLIEKWIAEYKKLKPEPILLLQRLRLPRTAVYSISCFLM